MRTTESKILAGIYPTKMCFKFPSKNIALYTQNMLHLY